MQTLTINQKPVALKEYKGQRVVTFKDVDCVHERPAGTSRVTFNRNKKRFCEELDYFVCDAYEAKKTLCITAPNGVVLLTESGYLMLVKTFDDDLAWKVQRELVNNYFRFRTDRYAMPKAPTAPENELPTATAKTYKGQNVLLLKDLSAITGISSGTFSYHIRRRKGYFVEGVDYWLLEGAELIRFKAENKMRQSMAKSLTLITYEGLKKLSRLMQDMPGDMATLLVDLPQPHPLPLQKVPKNDPVCDVPSNREARKIMGEMQAHATAVQVILEHYNCFRPESERKGIAETLQSVCGRLYSKSCELQHVKYNLVEEHK